MGSPSIKVMNIAKLVQMIFIAWHRYFEYVSYLLHGIDMIVLSVLIWSLSISIGISNWASSIEKSTSWNFANHFDAFDLVIASSSYAAQTFFCVSQLCVPFLK